MLRLATALALLATLTLPTVAEAKIGMPVVNEGSKLGECIQFGKWTTSRATKVYAKPGDKSAVVATVPAKTVVTGLESRLVTTMMGSAKIPSARDVYDADHNVVGKLKKGDTVLIVYYEGEGYYQIAFQDRLRSAELTDLQRDSSDLPGGQNPTVEWWVKVKTKAGQVGWVNADEAPLKGMDHCANGGHPD